MYPNGILEAQRTASIPVPITQNIVTIPQIPKAQSPEVGIEGQMTSQNMVNMSMLLNKLQMPNFAEQLQ